MFSASSGLSPRRALQTRQMRFGWRLSNLMRCCSQKPNSRSRTETSGGPSSRLIRTAVPATTRLKGQTKGSGQLPSFAHAVTGPFTKIDPRVIET